MKFFVFISCALAVASAGGVGPYYYAGPYAHYGQHIPVIGPNGVPVETPEVQLAKAEHFAAHAKAGGASHYTDDGQYHAGYEGQYIATDEGQYHPTAYEGHYVPTVYAGHYAVPQISHNGVPLDTPEVAAVKAGHFAAHAEAAVRNGHYYAAPYAVGAYGPVDTPEVQLAKSAHFAAHAEANARSGHYRKRRSAVVSVNGVPLDTPEVEAAKAHHFAAHAEANARNSLVSVYSPHVYSSAYSPHVYAHHVYPQHIPVIDHNGVPVETAEVQIAKAHHYAAHAEANARTGVAPLFYGSHYATPYFYGSAVHGVPIDTPEVQAAKIEHFAAHAAVKGHY